MRSKVAVNSVGLEELACLDELALALSLVALEVAGEPLSAALLSSVGPPQLTKSPRERTLTNKDFLFIMFFIAHRGVILSLCFYYSKRSGFYNAYFAIETFFTNKKAK